MKPSTMINNDHLTWKYFCVTIATLLEGGDHTSGMVKSVSSENDLQRGSQNATSHSDDRKFQVDQIFTVKRSQDCNENEMWQKFRESSRC